MVASTAAREMIMDIARGPDAVPPFADDGAAAARAIAALRTAQFDATIDFDDGTSLGMQLRFDLGAGAEPARLYVVAIARRGAVITQAGEFVQVGERSWQRQADGSWLPGETGGERAASAESIRRRVNALLPRLESGQRLSIDRAPDLSLLTWTDEALNAEMLLEIEPTSGIPRRFRRETRSTGTVLTVLCSNWNRAVQINPPDFPGGRPVGTRDTPLR
jgi:hypothetical protein